MKNTKFYLAYDRFCVLGSGLSGSTIANLLSKRYSIKILEKAKGIGGRSSTSKMGNTVRFDHGLQYYSPKDLEFKKFVNRLIKKKNIKDLERRSFRFYIQK